MDVLFTVIELCKWFVDSVEQNIEAIQTLRDMHASIVRMHPHLVKIKLKKQDESDVLDNLWQCLEDAKRIYRKYKHGYNIKRHY